MKFLLSLFSLSFVIVLGAAIIVIGSIWVFQSQGPLQNDMIVSVKRGMGVQDIAQTLEVENVIINQYPFIIGAKLKNNGKPLQAGDYEITAGASMASILDKMQKGDVARRFFTIPEGRTSYEIVQILNDVDGLDGKVTDIPPEGSLLPETYDYTSDNTTTDKIARMQEAMNKTLDDAWQNRNKDLPFDTAEEALILASIVEKETGVAEEYAKVAGVVVNRLKIGMPLQTDPTVIYGITLGKHQNDGKGPLGRRLLTKDVRKDTPFNTYTRNGLPPTPICNPGKAAINATMNPATHDYLYFVADGTGGHAFGKTLAEHNANVAKWRKIRNSK
jgi:UPF0755 protein